MSPQSKVFEKIFFNADIRGFHADIRRFICDHLRLICENLRSTRRVLHDSLKGITLTELLVAIILFVLISLSLTTVDIASRRFLKRADLEARAQAEAAQALEHIAKRLSLTTGHAESVNMTNYTKEYLDGWGGGNVTTKALTHCWGIEYNSSQPHTIKANTRRYLGYPTQMPNYACPEGRQWIRYFWNNTDKTLYYWRTWDPNNPRNTRMVISRRITNLRFATEPLYYAKPFPYWWSNGTEDPDYGLTGDMNVINITVSARYYPDRPAGIENPEVNLTTTVVARPMSKH